MSREKNIIEFDTHSDGIDLRKIVTSFLRSWPIIFLILLFWVFLGALLIVLVQPSYKIKSSIIIEEPQRMYDPYRYTLGPQSFNPPDDEYFVNEKIRVKSTPIIEKAIDSLNYNIAYFKNGFAKTGIHGECPFEVETGSEWMDTENDLAFNQTIDIRIINDREFHLVGQLMGIKSGAKFNLNESYEFGEQIALGEGSIKVIRKNDQLGKFGFSILDKEATIIDVLDRLDVDTEELNATVMSLILTGRVPEKQIEFLNVLGGVYIQEHLKEKRKIHLHVNEFIGKELEKLQNDLIEKEQNVSLFKLNNNVNSLTRKASIILSQTTKLENEAANLVIREKYFDYVENFLNNAENYEKLISPQAFKINDPLLLDLTSELVQLQIEKNHLIVEGKESHPSLALLNSKIQGLKNSIIQSVEGFRVSNKIRTDEVKERLKDLDEDSNSIPQIEREFIDVEREFNTAETAYLEMKRKKSDSDIALQSIVSDFQIIEPAYIVDGEPFFPNKMVIAVLVLLLSVISWVVYIVYKFGFKSDIKDLQDLYPILGEVELDGNINYTNISSASVLQKYSSSFAYENFKALALKVFERISTKGKLILVTSHNVAEGKSFVSSGLGLIFAESGKKVLVLDLSNPGAKNKSYLGVDFSIKGEIQETFHTNLHYSEKSEWGIKIGLSQMAVIQKELTQLKKKYDIIIFDASPYTLRAEILEMMRICDRNLMIFRRKISKEEDFRAFNLSIPEDIQNKTGIVFNGEIDRFDQLPRKARKYYKNKPSSLIHILRKSLNKI
ncbi:MAG: hypothetical protein AAF487_13355 [Bacteroidota bacterium]